IRLILSVSLLVQLAAPLLAADIDLTNAVVLTPPGIAGPEAKAVQMFMEEVEKRSLVHWDQKDSWPATGPVIVAGRAAGVRKLIGDRVTLPENLGDGGREGYAIGTATVRDAPLVWIAGNDPRGTLFGVGRLLRELRIDRKRVTLPAGFA